MNDDLIGVELCAAAKNVIALAAGAFDGIGAGDNAKAALITRGLAEMARLGEAAGADPDTFFGLAGMGDLIVTCWHPTGRNRRAGELIARGARRTRPSPRSARSSRGSRPRPSCAGSRTASGVELPITESVCSVLEGASLVDLATPDGAADRRVGAGGSADRPGRCTRSAGSRHTADVTADRR